MPVSLFYQLFYILKASISNKKYSDLEYPRSGYILAAMNIRKSIYTPEYQAVIERLKKARLSLKLTQKDAAKSLGVGQSFISKIENGQYRLDIIQLQQFAKLYKKRLSYFLQMK